MLTVTFCGAARTVTGSQYYLEYTEPSGKVFRFCVDSGMFQVGNRLNLFKINSRILFDPKKLDAIVLTHAHLDHCGRIPYLVKEGFGGRIYSTPATKEIAQIVMNDASRHLGEGEMAELTTMTGAITAEKVKTNRNEEEGKLYDENDVEQTMNRFRTYEYHDKFRIHQDLQVEFFDAGHILGSASVVITELTTGKNVIFSGDLGNIDKPIIKDPELICCFPRTTHIFTETTYGNRNHPTMNPKERLRELVNKTTDRKGKILIPSFSVERAQEVIYHLVELMREGKIRNIPIYLDSPMAMKVLNVVLDHPELYDDKIKKKIRENTNPLVYKKLKILETVDDSKSINGQKDSCIIIAGSGMMNGGRILKHLQFYIEDENNMLIIVGYMAVGTLGRQILENQEEVEVDGRMFKLKIEHHKINEFSAHADQTQLVKWAASIITDIPSAHKNPPTLFLMHGEKEQVEGFKTEIHARLGNNVQTYWPHFGEVVTMWE
jgi:metallo-beta-lactamase family protein